MYIVACGSNSGIVNWKFMLVHLMPDDKYVDTFVKDVLAINDGTQHQFLVASPTPYKYIDPSLGYESVIINDPVFEERMNSLSSDDLVVLHSLSNPHIYWLSNTHIKAKIGWVFWGGDFYQNCYPDIKLYDPLTQAYLDSSKPKLSPFGLLHIYRQFKQEQKEKNHVAERRRIVAKAIAKLDYIYHFMESDYNMVKQFYPTKAELTYFYYRQPSSFDEIELIAQASTPPAIFKGFKKKLWIGNCGYDHVNHLDAFDLLKGIDKDTAVVVPLNYGDADYIDHIISKGQKMFGDRFVPITEYMPFDEFVAHLNFVDASIMPHNTPRAVGNIALLMAFGKRVYVKKHVSTYQWFHDNDAKLDDIADFSLNECYVPLPKADTQKAIEFCRRVLSGSSPFDVIRNMINTAGH